MIINFKEHKLSNSLMIFNQYKKVTGRSLEHDIKQIQKRQEILDNPKSTDEEINKCFEMEVDPIEVTQIIYYASRCAAEETTLDFEKTINEISMEDLADGSLEKLIMELMAGKKKEKAKQGMLTFLQKKK